MDTLHGRAIIRSGKGGRDRAVPFGSQTAAVLDRYIRARRTHKLAERSALWLPTRAAGSFGYTSLYRALRRRAALAGIPDFHPHLLRHIRHPLAGRGRVQGGLMGLPGGANGSADRYTAATASERAADEAKRLRLGDL